VKFYVDAKAEVRAKRRLAQLIERDNRDKNREQAPLKAADDAHLIETSVMGIDEVFETAVRICDAVLGR